MKTVILKISFILLIISLMGAGCEKNEEPQLPTTTLIGENTFGCLVDGEVWLPKDYDLFPMKHVVLERVDNQRIWRIGVRKGAASNFYFSIYEDSIKVGTVNIPVDDSNDIGIYYASQQFENSSFRWNDSLSGALIITRLDTVNKIIAGTFEFDLINSHNERVEVRNGRFDLIIDQIQQ